MSCVNNPKTTSAEATYVSPRNTKRD